MAATSNHRNKSGNGRNQGAQTSGRSAAAVQDEASSAFETMGDMADQASDYAAETAEEAQDCIRDHSGKAVLVSLVAGLGIGLLIGKAIGASRQEPKSRRYRAMAEGFGSRLMERIESMVPDALAEHFNK